MRPLKPAEILDLTIETGITKCNSSFSRLLILGFLAGAYISLAGIGASMGTFNLVANPETFGLGRLISGCVFATGLTIVVLAGAELFTGNTLILVAALEKKVRYVSMFRNWVIVYIANLLGAILIAWMLSQTGLLNVGDNLVGAVTLRIASGKVNLTFVQAFILGILCNWLVCLAVWMSSGADSTIGKIFSIFFPIMLFVTAGFEHCVANMFYIPAGIFAKANEAFVILSGVTQDALNNLTWSGFFINNLIPVTLGNFIGGTCFVAIAYWYAYKKA